MPRTGRPGASAWTAEKHDIAYGLMKMIRSIQSGKAMQTNKNRWVDFLTVFDCSAGSGADEHNGGDSAIVRFLSDKTKVDVYTYLFERDRDVARRLSGVMQNRASNNRWSVHARDCGHINSILENHWDRSGKQLPGFLYYDPNGEPSAAEAIAMAMANQRLSPMDCLIHFSATSPKRNKRTAEEWLGPIFKTKRRWLIRPLETMWQWCFIVGTNWRGFPPWEKQGFVELQSAEGVEIWQKANTPRTKSTLLIQDS